MLNFELESVVNQLNADSAAIMMPDKDRKYLFCLDSYNMPPEWVEIKNSFDEKIPGGVAEVYKTGKSAITNHLDKTVEGFYIESVMIVPIKHGQKTVAVLEVIHDKDSKVFSAEDRLIAENYAKKTEPFLL